MKSSNGLNDNNSRHAVSGSYMLRKAILDSIFTTKLRSVFFGLIMTIVAIKRKLQVQITC
jgi:hypothetical protein